MIYASGEVEVSVMVELCQCVYAGKECQINSKQVCWHKFSRKREMLESAILTEE